MSLIVIENLSKSFKGNPLFENASVSFEEGRIYGIIGHNGSGKSVLFKMICGFIKPDRGKITINAKYRSKQFPKKFGIIIDRPGYNASKSGLDNLIQLANIQRQANEQDVKEAMRLVGLDPNNKKKVKTYSLGMKQKLALAQAIMEDQEVLLLDEPFNALDEASVHQIRDLLLQYKTQGKSIILTSHNKEDIDLLCDHVFRVNNYKLEQVL